MSLLTERRNNKDKFLPMERYTSIKTILALETIMKSKIHHLGVKKTFLNGVVKEEVYMEQSLGVETHDRKTHV